LLFDGFSFASPSVVEKLTGKLGAIQRYNGLEVPAGYFLEAMERLRHRYLNVPLDAIIHPVSTQVRKVVKEEQIAANQALAQKWEDIKELLKPATEKSIQSNQLSTDTEPPSEPLSTSWLRGKGQRTNVGFYGVGIAILLVMVLGIVSLNAFLNDQQSSVSTLASDVSANAIASQPSETSSVDTATVEQTATVPSDTPTVTAPTVTLTPTLGTGSTMVSSRDGMTLVYIPAGEFRMGFQGQESDEKPVHVVYLDSFWIDQTEVTNTMYALCVSDGECNRPASFSSATRGSYYGNTEFGEYPVIFVSWEDANSYCEWAARRLPTEAEWEKAARGRDQRSYPWGEQIDCTRANFFNEPGLCTGDTTPVNDYESGISPYGVYNMAGNVWEWVSDWYDPDFYDISPPANPLGPSTGELRVVRGGGWDDTHFLTRSSNRGSYAPAGRVNNRGFRCAASE
jgi:formylglycine-generating enzyme required for sulfatase activity